MSGTENNKELRFGFGENWSSFVKNAINDVRIAESVKDLKRMLSVEDLKGKVFLDIGCGSGLSSLSACIIGAEKVVAFDFDESSVEASRELRTRAEIPEERWNISRGSVLDDEFLSTLNKADVVYSWGVLHHTGNMWEAIEKAVGLVKPGGLFAISIYNKVGGRKGSAKWWKKKQAYNRASPTKQRIIEYIYVGSVIFDLLKSRRNPVSYIRNYPRDRGRGMDFMHDARDWIGGFPFEYASPGEVFNYVYKKSGMNLVYLNTLEGHSCNEFTFVNDQV